MSAVLCARCAGIDEATIAFSSSSTTPDEFVFGQAVLGVGSNVTLAFSTLDGYDFDGFLLFLNDRLIWLKTDEASTRTYSFDADIFPSDENGAVTFSFDFSKEVFLVYPGVVIGKFAPILRGAE